MQSMFVADDSIKSSLESFFFLCTQLVLHDNKKRLFKDWPSLIFKLYKEPLDDVSVGIPQ